MMFRCERHSNCTHHIARLLVLTLNAALRHESQKCPFARHRACHHVVLGDAFGSVVLGLASGELRAAPGNGGVDHATLSRAEKTLFRCSLFRGL